MYSPVLSVPARRVSGWVAETDPRYARAWLEALPLTNSAEVARELYQALYTVNRVELKVHVRLELMALYDPAIAGVCNGLQAHLSHTPPPLGPKKRQLAEFVRRLHIEMAYGYKCCLRDLSSVRLLLRRKPRLIGCIERALHHLSEVLLRSYLVYLPYPSGVWREIHELYRLAESLHALGEPIEAAEPTTLGERYIRTLLMGLANPYQLPHSAVHQLNAFLAQWAKQAHLVRAPAREGAGCFTVDLTADAPPVPFTKKQESNGPNARVLDTQALLQTLQGYLSRFEMDGSIEKLGLGVDCLDSTCIELLRRMTRALGEGARRRFARRQRSTNVFVCVGLNALHFFASGQRPFATYIKALPWLDQTGRAVQAPDAAFVELDDEEPSVDKKPRGLADALKSLPAENPRVDRWQLRDIGPQGLSMTRYGDAMTPIRVGELIGVQQPSDFGRWRTAVIRWVKSPEPNSVEVGVEVLAAGVMPVAVRRADQPNAWPALQLPAAEVMQRPATLLLSRGMCQIGDELELVEEENGVRRVRVLRLLERTGAFEQVVYADSAPRR